VSASVNLPLHHKVQKFSSGTGLPDGHGKRAIKRLWWCCQYCARRIHKYLFNYITIKLNKSTLKTVICMTACKLNDNITNFPQFLRASPTDAPALCPWNPLGIFILLYRIAPRLLGGWTPLSCTNKDNIMSLGIISFLLYFCNLLCHYCSYSLSRYMVVNFVCHVCITDTKWANARTK